MHRLTCTAGPCACAVMLPMDAMYCLPLYTKPVHMRCMRRVAHAGHDCVSPYCRVMLLAVPALCCLACRLIGPFHAVLRRVCVACRVSASHSAIPKGSEILISYLGRPQLWPVELRRAELKENYGFECDCDRCKLELTHIDKVGDTEMYTLPGTGQPRARRVSCTVYCRDICSECRELLARLSHAYRTWAQRMIWPKHACMHAPCTCVCVCVTHTSQLDPSQYDELYARVHSRMQEQYQSAVQEGDREELETLYGDLQVPCTHTDIHTRTRTHTGAHPQRTPRGWYAWFYLSMAC